MPASPEQPIEDPATHYGLATSSYDRTASLLISLLILTGVAVLLLLAIWLTARIFPKETATPVVMQEIGDGGGFSDSSELDPDIEDPGMETEFEEPDLAQTLATISDALATKSAVFEDPSLWEETTTGRQGNPGDGRAPGNGHGRPGIPRRWEVQFLDGNTLQTYAEQLDYFGIELGVLQLGGKVAYASGLAQPKPSARIGPSDREPRYYLTWESGPLQEADKKLLEKAGISVQGRPILKFLPSELERRLAAMEQEAAGLNKDKVRATYFGVRRAGDGYEFYVVDQSIGY